jgi:hypothetical protein
VRRAVDSSALVTSSNIRKVTPVEQLRELLSREQHEALVRVREMLLSQQDCTNLVQQDVENELLATQRTIP